MTSSALIPAKTKRNVAVLVAAQAILGAQMPMIFTVGALAGGILSENPCFVTLPITMLVFGSMTTAPWLSSLMQIAGRRTGFLVGTLGGTLGALTAALALWVGSFPLLLLGSYLSGIYMSANGFLRFAAADTVEGDFQPKAISYVMAGGLVSALIGPPLGTAVAESYAVPFVGTYLAAAAINVVGAFLFLGLDIPRPPKPEPGADGGRTRMQLLSSPTILVAIICAMVSYALMNLVMTSTPLAVVGCGFATSSAGLVVSAHVIAMYAPSFFTGHLIARFGARTIVAVGLACLAAAGGVALMGVELANFFGALMLLGLGWNFGFIGATSLLSKAHTAAERGRVQGMNDSIVFGCVTVASLASGGLMNCSGGDVIQGWTAVNLAMLPFLALAGGALIWLAVMRPNGSRFS
ncbi:MFS transporter [Roseicyclus sp. F158]|uniref:MFS transporter n=1 Tax=Tropicimonas omnivorans TaxID=3075590 RepID=A0ABU3DIE1_9RHOB|nr:MFS transporter [Roseicyclus sp. F158]MDT0683495.1 MFS transporter [Roseicyclus sp. F158]